MLELGADGLRRALLDGLLIATTLPHAIDDRHVGVHVAFDGLDEVPLEPRTPELTVGVDVNASGLLAVERATDGGVFDEGQDIGIDLPCVELDPRFLDTHGAQEAADLICGELLCHYCSCV